MNLFYFFTKIDLQDLKGDCNVQIRNKAGANPAGI